MKYRAKVSDKYPFPIWVEGNYITNPPVRPRDGMKPPKGHYIDKGGYPGANVYEINLETLCRESDKKDIAGTLIYENDFLRYVNEERQGKEIYSYGIAELNKSGLEIFDFLTGEIIGPGEGQKLKVIGNVFDNNNFIEDLKSYAEFKNGDLPYIPMINVQIGNYPYWQIECQKCGYIAWGTVFKGKCSRCSGFVDCRLASEITKESVSM